MSAPDDLVLSRLGQIAVTVHDVDRATAFYRDTLRVPFLFAAPNLAFFDCGGVRLMLALPETPELDHPSSILYFKVDDARAAFEVLSARGVQFEGEPLVVHRDERHELWMASFRDSEDNLLAVMSETPIG